MNIPGENLVGLYTANEFLTRINLMGAYDFLGDQPGGAGSREPPGKTASLECDDRVAELLGPLGRPAAIELARCV